jgi:hypothetical protein
MLGWLGGCIRVRELVGQLGRSISTSRAYT